MENKCKYVVLKPNVVFYAFGGCYEVARITDKFIFYIKTRGEGTLRDAWEEKISKKNILFFSKKDITEEIYEWNKVCWREHKEFENRIKSLQKNIEKQHSTQGE